MSQIYALLSVKILGLKMCECKRKDKYQVWMNRVVIMVDRTGQAFTILALLFMNVLLLTRKARNGNRLRIHRVEKYNDAKKHPY